MLTIHAGGGSEMMRAAQDSATQTALQFGRTAPLVVGVTVLTSMDSHTLGEVGCEANPGSQVERLANLAIKAGLGAWSVPRSKLLPFDRCCRKTCS